MSDTSSNETTHRSYGTYEVLPDLKVLSTIANGAASTAILLDTVQELITEGSKLLSLSNQGHEYLNVRQGTDVRGTVNLSLVEFKGIDDALGLQFSVDATGQTIGMCAAADVDIFLATAHDHTSAGTDTGANITLAPSPAGPPSAVVEVFDNINSTRTTIGLAGGANPAITTNFGRGTGWTFTGDATKTTAKSTVVDGVTTAFIFDTNVAYANAAANLLKISNNGAVKVTVDKDGNIAATGLTTTGEITATGGITATELATTGAQYVHRQDSSLQMAIAAANAIRIILLAHAADGAEHYSATKTAHVENASVDGTVNGIITVLDASAFIVGDVVVVNDDGTEGPTAFVYVVGITDLGGPGPYTLHIQDAAVGGADVDLSAYLVDNTAAVVLSGRAAPDTVNFAAMPAACTNLATCKTLVAYQLTSYVAHDTDAKAATPTYHNTQYAGSNLIDASPPATLDNCLDRLVDLQTKYNAHDADTDAHTTGSLHQDTSTIYSYSTVRSDYIVEVSNTVLSPTITLSTADCVDGRLIVVKDTSGGAGASNIFVSTEGGELIDDEGTYKIDTNYNSLAFYSTGTTWHSLFVPAQALPH